MNIKTLPLLIGIFCWSIFTNAKSKNETIVLSAGCFWGVEEFFRKIPGVQETEVGYIGGQKMNPSYDEVTTGNTGHAEAVKINFDPEKITLEKLLDQFFKMHDPTTLNRQGNDIGTQYRSAIFYSNAEQKNIIEAFKKKVELSNAWKGKIHTEVSSMKNFYPAEKYHQKYLIKNPGGYDNHYLRKINFH